MKSSFIHPDRILVPDFVTRPFDKVADARDRASIEAHGIEQDLVLVPDSKGGLLLCDGLRRRRIAQALKLPKVPFIVSVPPKGKTPEQHCRETRLRLHIHIEDLKPSAKCSFIVDLKERLGLNNKQVAAWVGIDQDSVTNWMDVRNYIPEVVAALDSEALTMNAARVFNGMTEEGQRHAWHESAPAILHTPGELLHKEFRKLYGPDRYPHFYRKPEVIKRRLAQGAAKRVARPITGAEKMRLQNSLETKTRFVQDEESLTRRREKEIQASIPLIRGIMRDEELRRMKPITPQMVEEFELFQTYYS